MDDSPYWARVFFIIRRECSMKTLVKVMIALALSAAFAGCSGLASTYDDPSAYSQKQD
jgi:hypothetical protein